ncbi:MAG: hypothetical protein QW096_12320 [Thermofilaceae archaeon]
MDGVNRFIANLAGTFKLLGHEVFILSWSHRGAAEELSRWFKTVHGLGVEVDVAALRAPEDRDRWLTMLFDWFTKGSIRSQYSEVNDLTLVDAEPREYLKLKSYRDLLELAMKRPTKLNLLRASAHPLVKAILSLRMLMVVIAAKSSCARPLRVERW